MGVYQSLINHQLYENKNLGEEEILKKNWTQSKANIWCPSYRGLVGPTAGSSPRICKMTTLRESTNTNSDVQIIHPDD